MKPSQAAGTVEPRPPGSAAAALTPHLLCQVTADCGGPVPGPVGATSQRHQVFPDDFLALGNCSVGT